MRFSCDSCQARYTIADDKVRGKILRVRCKKCGSAILLKELENDDDELGVGPGEEDATRVVRQDEVQRAMERSTPGPQQPASKFVSKAAQKSPPPPAAPAPAPARKPAPPAAPAEKKEWFAIIERAETGPLTRTEVGERAASGDITPRTYVWRDGMAQWARLKDVPELSDVLGASEPADDVRPPPALPSFDGEDESDEPSGADEADDDSAEEAFAAAQRETEEAAEAAKKAADAKKAEDDRKAADAKKKAEDDQKAADAKKKAEDDKKAADAKKAEDDKKAADAKKKAEDDKKAADAKKKAEDDKKAADAKKKAEDDKKAAAKKGGDKKSDAKKDGDKKASDAKKDEARSPALVPGPEGIGTQTGQVSLSALADHLAAEMGDGSTGAAAGPLTGIDDARAETPPTPLVGGAAEKPSHDPFAMVPDAPGFKPPEAGETTNAIIRASGAKERNWGKLIGGIAAGVLLLGGAGFLALKNAKVIEFQEAQPRQEQKTIDFSKVEAIDTGSLDILSGEAKRKAEEAARLAAEEEARKVAASTRGTGRGSSNDLSGLIPMDTDTAGAIKRPGSSSDTPSTDLNPELAAELAALQTAKARGTGPGTMAAKKFVDDSAFDVRRAGSESGGPDPQTVVKKVGEVQPAIGNCVATALRRSPDQKLGKVVVVATVGASGIVTKAEFREDRHNIASTELGACVRRTVKSIVFPSFEGDPVDLEIPLLLGAG